MHTSRRAAGPAAGAGPLRLAKPASAGPGAGEPQVAAAELLRRSRDANAALMRGDVARYCALAPLADDFLLMSPFGGTPSRAADYTEARLAALGRFFRNGSFEQEVVQSWAASDMVVLAVIERAHVEVGGLPAQPWALRVTLVFRREGGDWRLAHRHADPLANGITLEQAAALGRGEAARTDD